jgi:uncharacterized protein YgiB involved in biofilm formation
LRPRAAAITFPLKENDTVKRASGKVTLVLIGAALLNGCDRTIETHDLYLTKADCVHDWGEEQKCEQNYNASTGTYGYHGPGYAGARNAPTDRSLSRATGTQSAVRGGFGTSASAHASSSGS